MIQEFRVRNFLSFRQEQALSFVPTSDSYLEDKYCVQINQEVRLLKTAFIYGANGSGKTNLLIAINFLKNIITTAPANNNEPIEIDQFLLDTYSIDESSSFSTTFYIGGKKYIYDVELNDEIIIKEDLIYYPGVRKTKLFSRYYDSENNLSVIEFGTHVKLSRNEAIILQGNTLNNSTVLATLTKVNIANNILNEVLLFFKISVQNTLEPEHSMETFVIRNIEESKVCKEEILSLLKKGGFNISDLEVKSQEIEVTSDIQKIIEGAHFSEEKKNSIIAKGKIENKELIFLHKTSTGVYSLKSGVESSGTMRYIGMLTLLHSLIHDKSVMLIDEIEASLHYFLLRDFINLFLDNKETQSQLIFSTHDINILNEDFIRRDVIWFAEKNAEGETILERLPSKGLHKNVSIYNAYKKGLI